MINRNHMTRRGVQQKTLIWDNVIKPSKPANSYATQQQPKIQVRIPRNEFFTINADLSLSSMIAYFPDDSRWYIFSENIVKAYAGRLRYISEATLYLGMTDSGEYFILPVTETWKGYSKSWKETLMESIAIAEHQWVKIRSNNQSNCYEIIDHHRIQQAIDWSKDDLDDLLAEAFSNGAYVNSESHPLLAEIEY